MASPKTAKSQSATASKVKTLGITPAAATLEVAPKKPIQAELFELAMEQFHARNFNAALHGFQAAAEGPSSEIAYTARLHQRMCEQRMNRQQEEPQSAEDHYNLGVALINSRDLPQARIQLEAALELSNDADHFHYAMALLCGLEGNYAASARALARAIQLNSRNRSAARNDPDFQEILRHHEVRTVLDPEEIPTA